MTVSAIRTLYYTVEIPGQIYDGWVESLVNKIPIPQEAIGYVLGLPAEANYVVNKSDGDELIK